MNYFCDCCKIDLFKGVLFGDNIFNDNDCIEIGLI